MKPGFVYLLRADNGLYKIGRSGCPAQRLTDFTTLPVAVEFVHEIRTDDMGWLEGNLHRLYAGCRVRGEWFRLSEADVSAITATAVCYRKGEPAASPVSPSHPKVAAKIDAKVYRSAQIVAAARGEAVSDYISRVAGLIAHQQLMEITAPFREADAQADDGEAQN